MASHIRRFLLRLPQLGRQISDSGWENIEAPAIDQLKTLQLLYNAEPIEHSGRTYHFKFDFSPLISYFSEFVSLQKEFKQTKDFNVWSYFSQRRADLFIECDLPKPLEECSEQAEAILEYILYEIFLVMAITNPGTFNLEAASFVDIPERHAIQGSVITHELNASTGLIENYYYEQDNNPWLKSSPVEISEVYKWVKRVHPRFSMVGANPASRRLLALLHLSKSDAYSGAGAAWLFNGLEALCGCGPGENRAALVRRISIILALSEGNKKLLKRKIGKLYDLRSAFVHGGLSTMHPSRNESLDKRVEEELAKTIGTTDFGVALIIASIRRLININCESPKFEESLII